MGSVTDDTVSEPHGALSAASVVSHRGGRILLVDADDKLKVSTMSAEAICSWS